MVRVIDIESLAPHCSDRILPVIFLFFHVRKLWLASLQSIGGSTQMPAYNSQSGTLGLPPPVKI